MSVSSITKSYGMGQFRSQTNAKNYLNSIVSSASADSINTVAATTKMTFQDKVIKEDFTQDACYHCKLTFTSDNVYDNTYDIKLVNFTDDNQTEVQSEYQYLTQITIPRYDVSADSIKIISFVDETGSNITMRVIESANKSNKHYVYYTDNQYYYYDNSTSIWTLLDSSSKYALNYIQELSTVDNDTYTVEFIFSPLISYTGLLIQKVRDNIDYSMVNNGIYGIQFGVQATINQIKDLLNSSSRIISTTQSTDALQYYPGLTRIGIWAHPNAWIMVNNEGIRIGATGYYEIAPTEVQIEHLGIVPDYTVDADNNWTTKDNYLIDYQYISSFTIDDD